MSLCRPGASLLWHTDANRSRCEQISLRLLFGRCLGDFGRVGSEELGAEFPFEDLAGGVAGKRFDNGNIVGHFELRQFGHAMRYNRGSVNRRTRLQGQYRQTYFAPFVVGHADDCAAV